MQSDKSQKKQLLACVENSCNTTHFHPERSTRMCYTVCRMESTTNIIHKMHWKGHGRYNLHTMLFKASGTVKHFTTLFLDGSCSLYYHYCYYYYYYYYCYYYYSSCEKL